LQEKNAEMRKESGNISAKWLPGRGLKQRDNYL